MIASAPNLDGGPRSDQTRSRPLPVLRGRLLSAVANVTHGITRRVPGLGLADGNIGYGPPRDQADAWEMRLQWSAAIGVDPDTLATAGQVHGASVLRVAATDAGRGASPGSGRIGLGDALITDEPGVALLALFADCLPIILVDPARPAVAVAHAGWRGTVADVAGAVVGAMAAAFGSDPNRLLAFLGPAIGPCCYEVGDDVTSAWRDRAGSVAGPALRQAEDVTTFDLRTANEVLLMRAGLRHDHIETSPVCTRCAGEAWFSLRGQGPLTGRFGAIIALAR